jgi:hypothetical protein
LEDAGLREIVVKTYEVNARRESSQLKRYSLRDTVEMVYRTLSLYIKSPALRERMRKTRRRFPKNLFKYLGYGVFVGRK